MDSWQPHGLITLPGMEALYLSAKTATSDPRENAATLLFQYLFQKRLFSEREFSCHSQVFPDDTEIEPCNLGIKYWTYDNTWQTLCFVEARGANHQTGTQVTALEEQVTGYCRRFLHANPDARRVFACTIVGASIRCWSFTRGDDLLEGFWGLDHEREHEREPLAHYLDVGIESNKQTLVDAFNFVKQNGDYGAALF
ncbi:hypothetical protein B0I35DRAFT_425135 [Stachybotrys elegans]|uniref:Uncharacterized protein n=1 Tax=Stachybotrys elegans TaxID=80388 RepID=A0A8K0T3A7_9HYPO|nr:hypothetical protein B0I35DRAFT_425135 [Stachybotrys elegans]